MVRLHCCVAASRIEVLENEKGVLRSPLEPHLTDCACERVAAIDEVRLRGDSCGGEVTCVVRRCPKGLGAPVFDKLEAELAKALMSLPASKARP